MLPNFVRTIVHSNIQFGLWSSRLKIPVDGEYEGYSESDTDKLGGRWLDVGDALKKIIEVSGFWISPEISSEQQAGLLMELTCLLSYIIELFSSRNTTSVKTSKTSP
ncbi:hypothetical protein ACFE35_30870 [Phormidesmis priestleyi ANT.L61.2]